MDNYCTVCQRSFSRPEHLQRHNESLIHQRKRLNTTRAPTVVKKIKYQQPAPNKNFGIRLIHRGLGDLFKIYRAQTKRVFRDLSLLSTVLLTHIVYLLERAVMDTNGIKGQLRCAATFSRGLKTTEEKTAWFAANQQIYLHSTNKEMEYARSMTEITKQIEEFTQNGSGWKIKSIDFIDLYISKYTPVHGNTYTKLPKWLSSKKAIINIKNDDDKCFMWSVLAAKHSVDEHRERVSKYKQFADELNFEGIPFPVSLDNIPRFEEQNNIAINVLGLEQGLHPLYTTKNRSSDPINLLLITPPDKPAHYCLIKNLDRLMYQQNKHKCQKCICPYCLCAFNSDARLKKHQDYCTSDKQRIEMPEDPRLQFHNVHRQFRSPYVMYADFECFTKPLDEHERGRMEQHIPNSYCLLGVNQCCGAPRFETPTLYRDDNPVKDFLETVIQKGEKFVSQRSTPMQMSDADDLQHKTAKQCYICNTDFGSDPKVRDHCHQCGKFRGAAHSTCNTKLYETRDIPVFFHNLQRYDGHLIM